VNTVMNLQVPQSARNLFTAGGTVSRSGLAVLRGISYFSPIKALSVQISTAPGVGEWRYDSVNVISVLIK
jgi:hypothetical protein